MVYRYYSAAFVTLRMESDGEYLTGLRFTGKESVLPEKAADIPVFEKTKGWLDVYFSGRMPDFTPDMRLSGTDFQIKVWKRLTEIPFGKTVTYGELAKELAAMTGKEKMSAQAIGGAVGKNPVGIIVPCHRVVGKGGKLTGFAGGIEVKRRLLELEGAF